MLDTSTIHRASAGFELRPARVGDAAALADLADIAGDGLPRYVWGQLAQPGESARDAGIARARRAEGSFSYTNAAVAEAGGRVSGCVVSYPLAERLPPIPADMPAMFRPLQELENRVPGSWYVNFLAVHAADRRRGLASRLMADVDRRARTAGYSRVTLIAADANADARAFYARCGYSELGSAPMVKDDWTGRGTDWILLARELTGVDPAVESTRSAATRRQ